MASPDAVRYARHLLLPELGREGQQRLLDARVLLIGMGGLGSPAALYLAAAGVGTLGLVDFDVVDESNLHRQIIHGTSDIGRSKLASAADAIRAINPDVRLELHEVPFGPSNARELVDAYGVVVDGIRAVDVWTTSEQFRLMGEQHQFGDVLVQVPDLAENGHRAQAVAHTRATQFKGNGFATAIHIWNRSPGDPVVGRQ